MNKSYPIITRLPLASSAASVEDTVTAIASQEWMKSQASAQYAALGANELTSLSAMIAYVAHKTSKSEFRVERDLADRFSVPNAKCLPASSFDAAIRYLVDMVSMV